MHATGAAERKERAVARFQTAPHGRRAYALGNARAIAQWKARVRKAWDGVSLRRLDSPTRAIDFGQSLRFEVGAYLNGLKPEDVIVEAVIGRPNKDFSVKSIHYALVAEDQDESTGVYRFGLNVTPDLCGKLEYRIRIYPCHELLTHPLEMGMMIWL